MTAEVSRLRPKRHDKITETLQLALDMPLGLKPSTRDDIAEALSRFQPPERDETYTMISHEQLRVVLKIINGGERPGMTLRVWTALVSHIQRDRNGVCAVMAGPTRLAADADTTPAEASRALNIMARANILLRLGPGRYAINPHVGLNGDLTRRGVAQQEAPRLRLVE